MLHSVFLSAIVVWLMELNRCIRFCNGWRSPCDIGRERCFKQKMGFFVASVGSGNGADLGGLAGTDKHCQSLAQAVGAGTALGMRT